MKNDSVKHKPREMWESELLIECLTKQKEIVMFLKRLNELINGSLFTDFIIFSVLLCALLFSGSHSGVSVKLAINICYIVTMIGILWMYYWHSNEISYYVRFHYRIREISYLIFYGFYSFKSSQLAISAYKSKWYDSSMKFKKMLIIFTLRSQRPIIMRAGFLIMKLEVFIAVRD